MKPSNDVQAAKMKLRNAEARLNEILAEHPRNTAKRRELIHAFWNDMATAKQIAPHTIPIHNRKKKDKDNAQTAN